LQLLAKDVIGVLGPQYWAIAHVISHAVNELHVPRISFPASDPVKIGQWLDVAVWKQQDMSKRERFGFRRLVSFLVFFIFIAWTGMA
jgi:hypothetical protein